jgi:hypothetical protein
VIGAVAGGLAGKGIAENINPTAEEEYWRENYHSRPYADAGTTYDTYHPAYQHGWEGSSKWSYDTWDEAEPHARRDWESGQGKAALEWDRAKLAARDAWERVKHPAHESAEDRDLKRIPR